MTTSRRNPDFLDQHLVLQKQARDQRVTHYGFSETHNVYIAGAVAIGSLSPSVLISCTPSVMIDDEINDRDPHEVKLLRGFIARIRVGTCSAVPMVSGAYFNPIPATSTYPQRWIPTDEPYPLKDRDQLLFYIEDGTGSPRDFHGAFVIEVRPGIIASGPMEGDSSNGGNGGEG